MEDTFNAFMPRTEQYMQDMNLNIQNNFASIKNLKVNVDQIANLIYERIIGPLPSNTIPNPNEQVKVIKLRRKKEVRGPTK